jgi:hypothetical protein
MDSQKERTFGRDSTRHNHTRTIARPIPPPGCRSRDLSTRQKRSKPRSLVRRVVRHVSQRPEKLVVWDLNPGPHGPEI